MNLEIFVGLSYELFLQTTKVDVLESYEAYDHVERERRRIEKIEKSLKLIEKENPSDTLKRYVLLFAYSSRKLATNENELFEFDICGSSNQKGRCNLCENENSQKKKAKCKKGMVKFFEDADVEEKTYVSLFCPSYSPKKKMLNSERQRLEKEVEFSKTQLTKFRKCLEDKLNKAGYKDYDVKEIEDTLLRLGKEYFKIMPLVFGKCIISVADKILHPILFSLSQKHNLYK